MNLWDMLKVSKGISFSDPMAVIWGKRCSKQMQELSGALPLTFVSCAGYLKDYRIYGNTIQDGTPTPDNPVEVLGCGEYDSELNGYKISVTVANGTEAVTTPVYIGSEPLHKIGNYADYVDYKRGVVVRRIYKLVLTGNETVYKDSVNNTLNISCKSDIITVFCTHFRNTNVIPSIDKRHGYAFIRNNVDKLYFGTILSLENFKSFLAEQYTNGTPVTVWYVLKKTKEELLEDLLPIQTIKGTNILTVDTEVQPSEMYIKGKIKPIGGNEND